MPKTSTASKSAAKKSTARKTSPKKVTAKKTTKGAKGAKGAKKSAKSAPKKATTSKTPRTRKEGLRAPQIRILSLLARNKHPLPRVEIAEKAEVDLAYCNSYIGSSKPEIRKKNDKNVCLSLLSAGFVSEQEPEDGERGMRYVITASGKKALAAAKAAK